MHAATMTPTISFTFPDASQAADFFAAIAEAFAKLAARGVAAYAPNSPVLRPAMTEPAPTGDSPGTVQLKEFLAEQPSLASVPSVPDAAPAKTRRPRKQTDAAAPVAAVEKPDGLAEVGVTPIAPATPAGEVTIEQLREAGNALAHAKTGAAVANVLKDFKAARYPDVPKADWPKLLAALTAAA